MAIRTGKGHRTKGWGGWSSGGIARSAALAAVLLGGCAAALFAGCAAVLLGGCAALENVGEPPVTGDPPSTNAATTSRKDVPFCPGGDRAKACVFGQNCRITEQGCQVCQCHTME